MSERDLLWDVIDVRKPSDPGELLEWLRAKKAIEAEAEAYWRRRLGDEWGLRVAEARAAALDEEVLAQAIFWVYGTADDARMVVREYKTRLAAIDAQREGSK